MLSTGGPPHPQRPRGRRASRLTRASSAFLTPPAWRCPEQQGGGSNTSVGDPRGPLPAPAARDPSEDLPHPSHPGTVPRAQPLWPAPLSGHQCPTPRPPRTRGQGASVKGNRLCRQKELFLARPEQRARLPARSAQASQPRVPDQRCSRATAALGRPRAVWVTVCTATSPGRGSRGL